MSIRYVVALKDPNTNEVEYIYFFGDNDIKYDSYKNISYATHFEYKIFANLAAVAFMGEFPNEVKDKLIVIEEYEEPNKDEYQGWKNYQTWNVALWIDNEAFMYENKMQFLRRHYDQDEENRGISANDVEQFCREELSVLGNGTLEAKTPDMNCHCEMNLVDWEEIAENWAIEAHENFGDTEETEDED